MQSIPRGEGVTPTLLSYDWTTTATSVRRVGGCSDRKEDKETWWWNSRTLKGVDAALGEGDKEHKRGIV